MHQNQSIISKDYDYERTARKVFDNLDVAESTRRDYQYRVGLFIEFAMREGLNNNSFLKFKRYLAARNDYSVSTKNKYLITAKILLQELHRNGRMPNITQNVRTFSQSKRHKVEGVNTEEMQLLTDSLHCLPITKENARLKAIISLLALQGLREVEVTRLDVKDLDLTASVAFVLGKGDDDKEPVYLHPETVKALRQHLKRNRISSGAEFISNSNSSRNHRLTTRAVRSLVTNIFQDLGIEKTPHGFRHFFTTTLISSYKGDLLEVARYTRHRTLEMLQVYNDNINRKADLPRYYGVFKQFRL